MNDYYYYYYHYYHHHPKVYQPNYSLFGEECDEALKSFTGDYVAFNKRELA
jgi:hypothetical protein